MQYDSLSKGYQIEKVVNLLIQEIASPLIQKKNVVIGKNEYDGEIFLGKGKTLLYEIFAGNLSSFRYQSLLDLLRETYFPYKTYLLIIARSYSSADRKIIGTLGEKIISSKVTLCFMDYRTLISLHRFSSNIQKENVVEHLKIIKRLFLEYLLSSESIISETSLKKSLSMAMNRMPFELQEVYAHAPSLPSSSRISAQFLQNLEDKMSQILHELQMLRVDVNQSRPSRELPKEEEFREIDLLKVEGDGSFPCPKCGSLISPKDDTGEKYQIHEIEERNGELSALVLLCNNCGTKIRLVGFKPHYRASSGDKIRRTYVSTGNKAQKKSINDYLLSMK
jgi:hypothetical protein